MAAGARLPPAADTVLLLRLVVMVLLLRSVVMVRLLRPVVMAVVNFLLLVLKPGASRPSSLRLWRARAE